MELSVICHSEVPESASRTSGECRESEEGGREGEREGKRERGTSQLAVSISGFSSNSSKLALDS